MTSPSKRASGPYRPTRLGQWEVIAKIAGGGMSTVYLARRFDPDPQLPNVVAIKIVRRDAATDSRFIEMFLQEGRLISRLVHPNIVRTLEVGADEEQHFIAMELMLGKSFQAIHEALVARKVRLNPDIAAWAAARVADALHYAHELTDEYGRPLGLVHRDVNPANFFGTFSGEVKLFDFGLAKATSRASSSALIAGKLSYLSPEQIMQMPLDRRSDVFSLGTTLWELLTSRRLFRRDTDAETVRAVQVGPIPDVRQVAAELPEELARIVRRALERNRDHRYPTTAHMARELDAFVFARNTPENVSARLAKLVDTLFPDEQKRQSGWLKPTITSSISRPAASVPPPSRVPMNLGVTAEVPPMSEIPSTTRDPSAKMRATSSAVSSPPPPTKRYASTPPPAAASPSVPPAATKKAPSLPPTRSPASIAPPANATPSNAPSRASLFPGVAGSVRPKAPIPLPSRARGDSIAPPRPSVAPKPMPAPVARPAPPKPPPSEPELVEELSSDTTEIEAIPETVIPDGETS